MNKDILKKENIILNVGRITKNEAIEKAGHLLVKGGYVNEDYIESMFDREKMINTYIGNGVAIPHGVNHSEKNINKSGIVILQSKEGILYDDNLAYLIIGIAGFGNEHLDILSSIAITVQDEENVKRATEAESVDDIYSLLLTSVK